MSNPNSSPQIQDHERSVFSNIYHGAMAEIAQIRMSRAANVMERMDHKQALYGDLGRLALEPAMSRLGRDELEDRVESFLNGDLQDIRNEHVDMMQQGQLPISADEFRASDTISGALAMPRTRTERFTDKRIDRRGHKMAVQSIYSRRYSEIYGSVDVRPDYHLRERAAEVIYGQSNSGQLPPLELKARLRDKLMGTSSMEGMSGQEKFFAKRQVTKERKRGAITATEMRLQKNDISAQQHKLGAETQKIVGKQQRKVNKQARRVSRQEFLSRHRSKRREQAIGRIQKQNSNLTKHTNR